MNVRTAAFKDYEQIEALYHESALSSQMSAYLGGDRPVPQRVLLKIWFALSKSLSAFLPLTEEGDALLVAASEDGTIVGFLQAQRSAKPVRVWHIVNICIADVNRREEIADELIATLCREAVSHRVERITVRMPFEHPLLTVFIEQSFHQILTEQILYHDSPERVPVRGMFEGGVREMRKEDREMVYFLYMKSTPASFASVEAPSVPAWLELFAGGALKQTNRDDLVQLVVEREAMVGFGCAVAGRDARPTQLFLLSDGRDRNACDELISELLAAIPQGPVSCVLRHFDELPMESLRKRGFEIYGTQVFLVRDVKASVKLAAPARKRKPLLAHAAAGTGITRAQADISAHSWQLFHQPDRTFILEDAKQL